MKRIGLVILIALLTIGVCGCMQNKTEVNNKENIVNNMIHYLNGKYPDDTFAYKGLFGGGAGANTKTIIVSSSNYPDADIYVRHSFDEGDIYTDNYLSVQYAAQTKSAINEIFDGLMSCDYLLFYEVDRFACPNRIGTMNFNDYVASKASCIGFTIVVNGILSDKVTFERALENKIVEAGICCSATIYFDNSSGAFDGLEEEGLSGYTFKKLYSDVFNFEMTSSKEFSSSKWGD